MKTVTYEGHEVETRCDVFCHACGSFSVTECVVAIVASDTLEILRRVTASACAACGAED
jgi:hypothetical protein